MITKDINKAIEALCRQEIVAIPTETVYGLAGNAFSDTAIRKIFALKNRPLFNPLIVHIKTIQQLSDVAREIPEKAMYLAQRLWPGSLTLVLKKQQHISDLLTGGKDTVAVRVPAHPITLELLEKLDFPLAAPSANPFGMVSPTSAAHVENYFKDSLEVILDGGACKKGIESTIIGFENELPIIYRLGAIALEEIEKIIGHVDIFKRGEIDIKAPGMLNKHYAPQTTTYLIEKNSIESILEQFPNQKIGLLLFKNKIKTPNNTVTQEILSEKGNFEEAAQNLYAALHRLDNKSLDLIIMEKLPNIELGASINDRLQRASKSFL